MMGLLLSLLYGFILFYIFEYACSYKDYIIVLLSLLLIIIMITNLQSFFEVILFNTGVIFALVYYTYRYLKTN